MILRGTVVILREASAAALSRLLPTLVTILVTAAATATILMTTGSALGTHNDVLQEIDSASSRAIIIQAPISAGITPDLVTRMRAIDSVEWVGAFGPSHDARNAELPDGELVSLRSAWSTDFNLLGITSNHLVNSAWATASSAERLAFDGPLGAVESTDSPSIPIVGEWAAPSFLAATGLSVLVPEVLDQTSPVTLAVVVVRKPHQAKAVAQLLTPLLGAIDIFQVKVSTSADLATLREALDARLGEFGDEILLLTFAATAGIVAVLLTALVLMRRKDYGRRSALGASRSAIVALVELQIAMAAATGVALGSGLALASLAMRNQELPPTAFVTANGVLLVSIAMTSGLPPSLIAASREPVRELRVP